MPPTEYNFKPVTRITIGAIGSPGKRVFYLQTRQSDQLVTLIIEKEQVRLLADKLEEFLAELRQRLPHLTEASSNYNEEEMALEQPIDPAFRVDLMGLGYDEESDLLVLVAREIEATDDGLKEASVARFWCTRSQLRASCKWGLEVASRGRPICGNCGQPRDPEGHFCPKSNGHKT
jgi:uncharacterized repeat protein (TIGR03847 family)